MYQPATEKAEGHLDVILPLDHTDELQVPEVRYVTPVSDTKAIWFSTLLNDAYAMAVIMQEPHSHQRALVSASILTDICFVANKAL